MYFRLEAFGKIDGLGVGLFAFFIEIRSKNNIFYFKSGMVFFDDQNRNFRRSNDFFGIGANKQFFKSVSPLRTHKNEVDVLFFANMRNTPKYFVEFNMFVYFYIL